jgi:hypothetical protein
MSPIGENRFMRSRVTGRPHPTMMKAYEPISNYLGRLLRFDVEATQLEVRAMPISALCILLPDEEARKSHEDGWKGFLNKLQLFFGDLEWAT